MASEYYTLLLETDGDPGARPMVIYKKFEKCFGSSVPDLTHQLTSSRWCYAVSSLSASDPIGYSLWLPGPSLSSQTCMPRPFPKYTPLKVSPRRRRRRLIGCSFSSNRNSGDRPPKPKRDMVRAVTPEEAPLLQENSGSPEPHKEIGESPAGTAACAA